MSIYNDFEHRGYKVIFHPSRDGGTGEGGDVLIGAPAIRYEFFAPNGEKLGEANSSEEAKEMIDQALGGEQEENSAFTINLTTEDFLEAVNDEELIALVESALEQEDTSAEDTKAIALELLKRFKEAKE